MRGGGLLKAFYNEYLEDVPGLFLVAENEQNGIIGFCMGYFCEYNEYQKLFLKHNFFRIFFRCIRLALTGNKAFYKKVFKKKSQAYVLNDKFNKYKASEKGDLLSICVLPEYRGTGTAQALMDSFLTQLEEQNRKLCLLTVESGNARAIGFYEKNGFSACRKTEKSTTYGVELAAENEGFLSDAEVG